MMLVILLIITILMLFLWIAQYTIEFTTEDANDSIDREYLFKVLPHIPRHIWNTLWIRKNEFHKSLDMDVRLLSVLNRIGRDRYIIDLERRRAIAHYNSLDE